jgi:hypothetical protein
VTVQEVDPETFYSVGNRLSELAGDVYDAFAVNVKILGDTGAMAGTDDAGTAWAASYDGRASEVLGAVNDLTVALQNYGGVVIQAGYNHAVAEYNATAGNQSPPPQRPPEPASVAGVLSAPPSAGGPGRGLFDNALGLVEQVGVPVPDGDTVKVDKAASAWDRLATVYQTATVVEALEVNARAFSDTHSPEVEYIAKDLRELRDATSAILAGCSELAQSCKNYRSALDDLRNQLEDILTDLAVELAVTATISIFAACVSFGAGAAAGAAKAAHTISKFAKTIRSAVSAWKISKRISEGVKKAHDIAGARKRLERIRNLGRKGKVAESPPRPKVAIPDGAPKAITGYTKHAEEQIVGRDGGTGVSREALEDAFRHPVRDVERLVDELGRVSYRYTGENATVAVNSKGEVITGWGGNRYGTGAAGG